VTKEDFGLIAEPDRLAQAFALATSAVVIVIGALLGGGDWFIRLLYISVGLPILFLMAVGITLGQGGHDLIALACIALAFVAGLALMPGPLGGSLPGGQILWAVLLGAAVLTVGRVLWSGVEARSRTPRPPLRRVVGSAQLVLAAAIFAVFVIAVANSHGISGIILPIFLVPFGGVLVAALGQWRGRSWPVLVADAPLAAYAFETLLGRGVHDYAPEVPVVAVVVMAAAATAIVASMIGAVPAMRRLVT
jgi:hypothetical protein